MLRAPQQSDFGYPRSDIKQKISTSKIYVSTISLKIAKQITHQIGSIWKRRWRNSATEQSLDTLSALRLFKQKNVVARSLI